MNYKTQVIIYNTNNAMLLCRRNRADGKWSLIGGALEGEEEAKICAVRKLREQTGLDITPDRLTLCDIAYGAHDDPDRIVTITFKTSVDEPFTLRPTDPEISEVVWKTNVSNVDWSSDEEKKAVANYFEKKKQEEVLAQLHYASFRNEEWVKRSGLCGCFYCLKTFAPADIVLWGDDNDQDPRTACCPYCGIDSVLTEYVPIGHITNMPQVLAAMRDKYFPSH